MEFPTVVMSPSNGTLSPEPPCRASPQLLTYSMVALEIDLLPSRGVAWPGLEWPGVAWRGRGGTRWAQATIPCVSPGPGVPLPPQPCAQVTWAGLRPPSQPKSNQPTKTPKTNKQKTKPRNSPGLSFRKLVLNKMRRFLLLPLLHYFLGGGSCPLVAACGFIGHCRPGGLQLPSKRGRVCDQSECGPGLYRLFSKLPTAEA